MKSFQNLRRRMTPPAAYTTANNPDRRTETANRSCGSRPMLMLSFANPIPAKTENTARRKITLVLGGVFRQGVREVIEIPVVLLDLDNERTPSFRSPPVAVLIVFGLYSWGRERS